MDLTVSRTASTYVPGDARDGVEAAWCVYADVVRDRCSTAIRCADPRESTLASDRGERKFGDAYDWSALSCAALRLWVVLGCSVDFASPRAVASNSWRTRGAKSKATCPQRGTWLYSAASVSVAMRKSPSVASRKYPLVAK
jgi:hypothetical protein